MKILTFDDLKSIKGVPYTRQHLRRLEQSGEFPRRLQLSEGRVGWLESEIDGWIGARATAREVA